MFIKFLRLKSKIQKYSLRENSVLLRKSPYSVQIQENTDHKKTPYLETFHVVILISSLVWIKSMTQKKHLVK